MALFGGRNKAKPQSNPAKVATKTADKEQVAEGPSKEDLPLQFSDKEIATARKWFAQGQKLTEDRNYDYAIESYLSGLKFWPEAVEEGYQKLRFAVIARREKGGKKPSKLEAMKHSMSGRDGLHNALWLWSRDPGNVSYLEGIVKNAAKNKCEDALLYFAPFYFEAAKSEKKVSKDRFQLIRKLYEETAERCERCSDYPKAVQFYKGALTALEVLSNLGKPGEFTHELTSLATRVTILQGKYGSSEDFRSSMKDSGAQQEIHDRDRMVVDDARLAELIEEARKEWQADSSVSVKLFKLVDLLCRKDDEKREAEAIRLLDSEYEKSDNYSFKMRADDIRMKQLRRKVRAMKAVGDEEMQKKAYIEELKFGLEIYQERVRKYPTDNKLKYEFGRLLVKVGKYDKAIPVLQEARNDPKNRTRCENLIGQCFYEKGYYAQAISTYNKAIELYELSASGDEMSKELHYWLGRSCEKSGNIEDAKKAFGQLLQWDYNYKDVRKRLEKLGEA